MPNPKQSSPIQATLATPVLRRIAIATPMLALLAAAGDQPATEPGAWERRIEYQSLTQNGQPVPDAPTPETEVKRRCISPALAATPKRFIFPPDREGCTVSSRSMADGLLAFTGSCAKGAENPAMTISGEGRYDRTSYSLDTVTEIQLDDGAPVLMRVRVSGRHVGACTKDDELFDPDRPPTATGK